jgi:transcription elongation regulator 1
VSAFSTWEKELSKIVFDERYLLLSSKERKTAFDEWVKDRAEKERAEKKKRAREAKDAFGTLLVEAKLTGKSSYREFDKKWGKDARFKAVEKSRDRESMFDDFIDEQRKKEKAEKTERREKVLLLHHFFIIFFCRTRVKLYLKKFNILYTFYTLQEVRFALIFIVHHFFFK